jgi:tetratricopeptide (TPR) repeat protein
MHRLNRGTDIHELLRKRSSSESQLCHSLAREVFTGRGAIVDAGPLPNQSASSFAEGLRANPRYVAGQHRVHCFGRNGESQVPQPIEILLVDAGEESRCRRVVEVFFPELLPESVVICRDYHNPWRPHIQLTMEYLSGYFELLAPRVESAAVFLCRRPVPQDVLHRAIAYNFTDDEQLRLLERAASRLPKEDRHHVQLAHILLRGRKGDPAGAREALGRLEADRPSVADFAGLRNYLDELEGWQQQSAGNFERVLQLSATMLAQRRTTHLLVMRGAAFSSLGRHEEAEQTLREAIRIRPCSGYAYIELARCLMHQRRFPDAESFLLQGIRDREAVGGTTAAQYIEMLRMVWAEKNKPRQDLIAMVQLRQEWGGEPEVWVLDAWTHMSVGDRESAAESLCTARQRGLPPERFQTLQSLMGLEDGPTVGGIPRPPLPSAAQEVFGSRGRQPWFTEKPKLPHRPAGMLGHSEASLCYYLAKEVFTGQGTILDAGSFLGKSAYFFAQGLLANPRYVAGRDRIHCFDNFLVNEEGTVRFAACELDRTIRIGDSIREIFEEQVATVRDLLEVHDGDFHTTDWPHRPVEILLVDIAKTESLNRRTVELFFPDLIPRRSVVIQQDYHHPWLPHIHVLMEYLADYFDLIVPRVDDSAAFLFRRPIPPEVLRRAIAWDFTYEEQVQLMDGAIARLPEEDRFYVGLARIVLHFQQPDWDRLRREFAELEAAFRASPRDYSLNPYFDEVRVHLHRS